MKKLKGIKKFITLAFTMSLMMSIFSINGYAASKLATPAAPTWNVETSTKITWAADADAKEYVVQLYKTEDSSTVSAANATGLKKAATPRTAAIDPITVEKGTIEYDFAAKIKELGAGFYTATVTAIGDGTNFSDSEPSEKSTEFNVKALAKEWFSIAKQTYTGSELTAVVSITAEGTAAGITNLQDVEISNNKLTLATTSQVVIGAKNPKFVGKVTADFVVEPAEVTVSGVTAKEKTYNGLANDISLDLTKAKMAGIIQGDTDHVTLEMPSQSTAISADAGEQSVTTTLTLVGAKAGNYKIVQPTDVKVKITPENLAITGVTAVNTTYGDATLNYAGTPTSKIPGLSYTYIYIGTTYPASSTAPTAAGDYTLTVSVDSATNKNYTGSQIVNFTIDKKALTINGIVIADKTYDGKDTATLAGGAIPTLSGLARDDDVTLGGTPTFTFNDKNAGENKPVTVTGYTLAGTDASNYTLNAVTATGKIDKATITVTASLSKDKIYDGTTSVNNANIDFKFAGMVAQEGITLRGHSGSYSDKNAGTDKTVTISGITLDGPTAVNYSLEKSTITCQGNITPKNVDVSTVNIIAFVGDPRPTPVVTYSGFIQGENESVLTSGVKTATFDPNVNDIITNPGEMTIKLAPTAANYTFTNKTPSAKLTVLSKTVGGTDPSTVIPTTPPTAPIPVILAGTSPLPAGVLPQDVKLVTLQTRNADEAKLQAAATAYGTGAYKSMVTKEIDLLYKTTSQTVPLKSYITIAIKTSDIGFDNIPSGHVAVIIHTLSNGSTEYITPTIANNVATFQVSSLSPFAFVVTVPKVAPTPTKAPTPAPEPEPESDQFWSIVHDKIHKQEKNTTLAYDAGARTTMPGAIINDCIAKKVTLSIKWDGGENVVLKPANMKNTKQEMYNLKDLVGKYDKSPSTGTTAKPTTEPSPSPSISPTPSATPTPTIAPTPEPTEAPAVAPKKGGFPWIIVVVIAAIVGFGVFMVVKKKGDEEE